MSTSRRLITGTTAFLAVLGSLLISATSAHADSPHCNGLLCAELTNVTTGSFRILEWTQGGFTGHFQLQTPSGANLNSIPDASYRANQGHPFVVARIDGRYCANQWRRNSSGNYDRVGGICWNINV